MNIHHLELFYYVARHGGISEAARRMPYGIQQPAVSAQVIQLEETLGVTLFHRRPFALTDEGRALFQFIEPFFGNLGAVAAKLRGDAAERIRIGASQTVLRDHLPAMLRNVRKQFPKLRVFLREGYQPELHEWIQSGQLDLVVTIVGGKLPGGLQHRSFLTLPLVLLAPKSSRWRSAEELWQQDRIDETLISLPEAEPICRNFQEGLRRRGVDWFTGIEVSSLDLVECYVTNGDGIGLGVAVPGAKPGPQLRVLPLPDFPPVTIGAIWRGKPSPLCRALIDELDRRARALPGR
jgi:DNA-binding transcriptional LysR family regulator